jgi:hypothetical protein
MGFFSGLTWGAALDRLGEFWSTLFPPQASDPGQALWVDHTTRRLRYALLQGFVDGSVYFGPFGVMLKREFNLYRHVRPVFNACDRIVDFHVTHTLGGPLDPEAGDGTALPTCLPFLPAAGALPGLRAGIASVLDASSFQAKKSLLCRWGAGLGDVGIEAVADTRRGVARLRVVHPAEVVSCTRDPYGNVKSYVIERWEVDPTDAKGVRPALYREECVNDGGTVVYRTLKDGTAYPWPGNPGDEWESHWGFVPLVLVKHIDGGTDWGSSEVAHAVIKTMETDDQGSNLGDQARKAVNPPWLLAGAALPPQPPIPPSPYPGSQNPYLGDPFCPPSAGAPPGSPYNGRPNLSVVMQERAGIPFFTCNGTDVKAQAMVAPLQIGDVSAHIDRLMESLHRAYPELVADEDPARGGLASGVSLDKARQKAKNKIEERRASYDPRVKQAVQMALTMAGTLGFPGYEGMGHGAFENGKLDFAIGERPVFMPTPAERLKEEAERSKAVSLYVAAGVPLKHALLMTGVEARTVDEVMADKAEEPRPQAPPAPGGPAAAAGTPAPAGDTTAAAPVPPADAPEPL